MVVMSYANRGNLRGNLTKIIGNNCNYKLFMLYNIISGLNDIHDQNLIHCDFHDGNILIHKDMMDKDEKVYIGDLGLCKPVESFFKKDGIYGVVPFMAPEVLRHKPYTQASDIYSFSMIMWEFTSGVPPFNDKAHDPQLTISICKGERPEISENTPQCYIDLMKICWDEDPAKRPSALEIKNIIKRWIDEKVIENIGDALIHHKYITKTHPQAYNKSRSLDFTSKELNEALESECLDCVVSSKNFNKTSESENIDDAPIHHKYITKTHSQAYNKSRSLDFTSKELNESLESGCLDCIVDEKSSKNFNETSESECLDCTVDDKSSKELNESIENKV
ncbi:hypothetical protein RclHR1_08500008 [Rhizophagus clarus]|uniref:Protein kinase domain-containing protein n=1 Tax=Rhizophagus clarus TaxID=94130 RepID=A0A2Z6S7H5_9GLOM|nr:hypothetical protein RclHR1_08500008 [Rhizophagus clarus]